MNKIRIHLADDHQVLLDGMKTLLHTVSEFEVVGCSLNGAFIYDEVVANKAEILILDISMPEKDGIAVLKEFAAKGFPCRVIILSSYDDLHIIKKVMNLGASGYLTKQCAGDQIIESIHSVSSGIEYFCDTVREKIFKVAVKDKPIIAAIKAVNKNELTSRELEIITLIAMEFSGKEISEQLYISTNTVETHRKNIIKKLNAKNTVSLVKFAIQNKLIDIKN